jgi:hypothetical protein
MNIITQIPLRTDTPLSLENEQQPLPGHVLHRPGR